MRKRHHIQFPREELYKLEQDEVFFYLIRGDKKERIRFHDYDKIYSIPGLYEQLFYDRLKCQSPVKVTQILKAALAQEQENPSELRVIDLGAGNGMMGESLARDHGASRLVGVDIIPEAAEATERDRPGVYDEYYVADFCNLHQGLRKEIGSWQFNCMTCVAALGFGDIPTKAFVEAFNIIRSEGWVAFNIKDTFLDASDQTGFSKTIRELIWSDYLDLYYLERYRHRLSMEGEPLPYFAIAGRKNADIPEGFLESKGIEL